MEDAITSSPFIPERSASPEPLRPIYAHLHHFKGKSKTLVAQGFDIDTEDLLIGRDLHCDVRIYDMGVSREHCRIKFDLEKRQVRGVVDVRTIVFLSRNR